MKQQNNPLLSNMAPIISVSQCTPQINLEKTIKQENTINKTEITWVNLCLLNLQSIYNFNVGITERTNNVVDDG